MKKIKKVMSLILTLALSLGLASSLTACNKTEETLNGSLNCDIIDNEHVKLASSDAVLINEGEEVYLEKTLTATVLPDYLPASEKKVDWFVVWGATTDKEISDCLAVVPESDGSNVCAVRCYDDFDVPAIVYAKTRIGGYTARCTVEYVGIPTELTLTSSQDATYDDSVAKNIYEINEGTSITFDITTDNIFGNTEKYVSNYIFTYKVVGLIKYALVDDNGNLTSRTHQSDGMAINVQEKYLYDYNIQLEEWSRNDIYYSEYAKVQIANNQLVISGVTGPEGLKGYGEFIDENDGLPFSSEYAFYSYGSEFVPYLEITIKETGSGVSQTIYVRVLSYVDSVELDNSKIIF